MTDFPNPNFRDRNKDNSLQQAVYIDEDTRRPKNKKKKEKTISRSFSKHT